MRPNNDSSIFLCIAALLLLACSAEQLCCALSSMPEMISSEMPRLLQPRQALQDPSPPGQLWCSHCSREGRDRSRTKERDLVLLSVLMNYSSANGQPCSLSGQFLSRHSEQTPLQCRDNCSSLQASRAPSISIHPSETLHAREVV